jgi:D-lactate dehydrogenase (cytochrome)
VLSGGRIIALERGEYSFDKDGICRHPEIGMLRIPTMDRNLSKNAAGYWLRPGMDLIDLLVGSEGTLCLISSIEVLLSQCPEELLSIVAFPESLEGAWSLLEGLRSSEARVRALELLDSDCLAFLRRHVTEEAPPPPMTAGAAVICRIESSSEGLDRTVDEVLALLSESGIRDDAVWGGTEEAEQRRIRSFRHSLPEAVNAEVSSRRRALPGIHKLGSDSAVAQNLLPAFYREMVSLLDDRGLEHLVFGHAGQGHLHANVLPASETGMAAGEDAMNRIAEVAVSLGGTVSAEHGLGRLKAHQLGLMYNTDEVEAMKGLRLAIDPERIFGPAIPWP